MPHVTYAYFTSRKNPLIKNFFDSLHREIAEDYSNKRIVVVDFWAKEPGRAEFIRSQAPEAAREALIHVPPKPTVWQGEHKLTEVHWWAACNARNTALCLAPDGWLVFVDDLSVMLPGYGKQILRAMQREKTITCGAYRKVKNLVVENGNIVTFEDHPGGRDNRFNYGNDIDGFPCGGNWMYGCSIAAPVEAMLEIGGWPEALCDGLSFEDVIAGIMMEKKDYRFVYDRLMMTYESEEGHHDGLVMKRSDYGTSPNDKSHAVLKIAQTGNGFHPNYFDESGIRGLRQRVLAGDPFPIVQIPQHEWFTGTALSELK